MRSFGPRVPEIALSKIFDSLKCAELARTSRKYSPTAGTDTTRQLERWRKSDEQREQDRGDAKTRGEEIDRRISDLVSGIGEFMGRRKDAA